MIGGFAWKQGDVVAGVDLAGREGVLCVSRIGADGVVTIEQLIPVRFHDEYERLVTRERLRAAEAAREAALAEWWSSIWEHVTTLENDVAGIIAVLDLHSPDTESRSWLTCPVCDATELDPGDWPCRTVVAIATAWGLEVPA